MIPVKIIRDCIAETPDQFYGRVPTVGPRTQLKAGDIGDYKGHVVGGMVRIDVKGKELIVHPGATDIN